MPHDWRIPERDKVGGASANWMDLYKSKTIGKLRGDRSEAIVVDKEDYDIKKGQLYEVQNILIRTMEAEQVTIYTEPAWTETSIANQMWNDLIGEGETPVWVHVSRADPTAFYGNNFRVDYQAFHGGKRGGVGIVILGGIALLSLLSVVLTSVIVLIYGPEKTLEFLKGAAEIAKQAAGDILPQFALPAGLILGSMVLLYLITRPSRYLKK